MNTEATLSHSILTPLHEASLGSSCYRIWAVPITVDRGKPTATDASLIGQNCLVRAPPRMLVRHARCPKAALASDWVVVVVHTRRCQQLSRASNASFRQKQRVASVLAGLAAAGGRFETS